MSAPVTIEHLPSNVPQLEHDGSNWAIFKGSFREAMRATQRWSYFDGTTVRPSVAAARADVFFDIAITN